MQTMPRPTPRPPNPAGERRPLVKRGALTASFEPLAIFWNGYPVPLSPCEAAIMALLVKRERAAWPELYDVLQSHGAQPGSCEVLIYRIRRKFVAIGAADPIETLRGWGLRIRVERDARGSRSLWIGGTELMDWA